MRYRPMRWPCRYMVNVQGAEGTTTAMVLNASESGLRLDGMTEFPVGAVVRLEFAGERIAGRVVWHRQGQTSLTVLGKLGPRQIDILRESHGRSHRPGLRQRPRFTELR